MSYFYFRIMWRDHVIEQHSLILTIDVMVYSHHTNQDETLTIRVITKLPNSEHTLFTLDVTIVIPRSTRMEQELLILPGNLSSSPVYSEVRVARSFVFCVHTVN
jgi:hypothetical protein